MVSCNYTKRNITAKLIILAVLTLLFTSSSVYAARNAIGIRIARNSEHLSPADWYIKYAPSYYGSDGSGPSSTSLAGYEAVSIGSCSGGQGETIYVNAANVVFADPGNPNPADDSIYTNIYIIACPINADQDTVDIFNQLLENWSFNINIKDTGAITASDQKAKIQRDTKRLSDLTALKGLLESYRVSGNNRYPNILSGSYEVGKSISYWPSWQENMGSELNSTMPTPPIGQGWGGLISLENWVDKNSETTWPTRMHYPDRVVVVYTPNGCRQIRVDKDGENQNWCEDGCGDCASGSLTSFEPNVSSYPNWPDELKDYTAVAQGTDYNNCEHILTIKDNRWAERTLGDDCPYIGWTPVGNLTITPETINTNWPTDVQNPDAVAIDWDKDGNRHIYAFKDNSYREYIDYNRPYVYKTTDHGLSYSLCTIFETAYPALADFSCSELITSNYSPVIATLTDRQVSIGKLFNYDIAVSDLDEDELNWTFEIDAVSYAPGEKATIGYCSDDGVSCVSDSDCASGTCEDWDIYFANTSQDNTKKIYTIAPSVIPAASPISFNITVDDGQGGSDTKSFDLTVAKIGPIITSMAIVSGNEIGEYQYDVEAYDPDGYYPLTYSWSGTYPTGMTANSINQNNGLIYGQSIAAGSYSVTIIVANTQGETVNQSFTIEIGEYCSNGIIGTGEECDDGDTNDGDGCNNSCQVEGGWICSDEPSVCSTASCIFKDDGSVTIPCTITD